MGSKRQIGLCYDCDDLLFQTEAINYEANRRILALRGITLDERTFNEIWVREGKGLREYLARAGLSFDAEVLRAERRLISHELVRANVPVVDGAKETLELLGKHYLQSLVSSGYRDDIHLLLELAFFKRFFDPILTVENVSEPKPNPEGLLCASYYMGVVPWNMAYIGDSQRDALAAHRAGMKFIAIPTDRTSDHDFRHAHAKLNSIRELTPELVESLF